MGIVIVMIVSLFVIGNICRWGRHIFRLSSIMYMIMPLSSSVCFDFHVRYAATADCYRPRRRGKPLMIPTTKQLCPYSIASCHHILYACMAIRE